MTIATLMLSSKEDLFPPPFIPLRLELDTFDFFLLRSLIIWGNITWKPLSDLRTNMSDIPWMWKVTITRVFSHCLPIPFLMFLFFNLLSSNHYERNLNFIDDRDKTFFNQYLIQFWTNMLILKQISTTIGEKNPENCMNFEAYSFTLIFSWECWWTQVRCPT